MVPTSLTNPSGRNSIIVATIVTPANNQAHQIAALTISACIPSIHGYSGSTTHVNNEATVTNQIAELHEASPYTQSNRLMALVHNPNQHTVMITVMIDQKTNVFQLMVTSLNHTPLTNKASNAAPACTTNFSFGLKRYLGCTSLPSSSIKFMTTNNANPIRNPTI
jgi:hypothetical protein